MELRYIIAYPFMLLAMLFTEWAAVIGTRRTAIEILDHIEQGKPFDDFILRF